MILAAVGDTGYNIMLFAHIVFAIIGLAPVVVDPIVAMQWQNDPSSLRKFAGTMATANQKIFANALILAGLLGFGVTGMSDSAWEMSDGWIIAAIIVWVAMIGVLHGALIPAAKAYASGDDAAQKRLQMVGPAVTILTLVQVYLMVFKPGA